MLTILALLFIFKGAKGGELLLKVMLCGIAVIIDAFILLCIFAAGSGIHWLFS